MRIRLVLALAVVAAACGVTAAARAGDGLAELFGRIAAQALDPNTLVERLVEAGGHTEFSGVQETIIYKPQYQTSRQKVFQKAGRRRVLYTSPKALRGKVVGSDGARALLPGGVMDLPDIGLGGDIERLLKQGLGTERVAGRTAFVVEVRPQSRAGGSLRIWIDAHKWVPLRWENRDASGALVSKTAYTSIQFNTPIPDSQVIPRSFGSRSAPISPLPLAIEDAERMVGFRVRVPGYLPRGYRRQAVTVSTFGQGGRCAHRVTLSYSNGLGLVTLAQAPARAIGKAPRSGRLVWSAPGLVWVQGGIHFVLCATPSLTREEMKRIAGSVR